MDKHIQCHGEEVLISVQVITASALIPVKSQGNPCVLHLYSFNLEVLKQKENVTTEANESIKAN